jgi:hypothetical protein
MAPMRQFKFESVTASRHQSRPSNQAKTSSIPPTTYLGEGQMTGIGRFHFGGFEHLAHNLPRAIDDLQAPTEITLYDAYDNSSEKKDHGAEHDQCDELQNQPPDRKRGGASRLKEDGRHEDEHEGNGADGGSDAARTKSLF